MLDTISDGCPEEFRCTNITGLAALQAIDLDSMAQEVVDINACAGDWLKRAEQEPPSAKLFDQMKDLDFRSQDMDGVMEGTARLARRRMEGFDKNLQQCRGVK